MFIQIVFPLMGLAFIAVFIFLIILLIKGIARRTALNGAPVQTSPAFVLSKRTSTSGGTFGGQSMGGVYGIVDTDCYVTFQLKNGERLAFRVGQKQFDLLAVKDIGMLSYQQSERDSRFIDFARKSV